MSHVLRISGCVMLSCFLAAAVHARCVVYDPNPPFTTSYGGDSLGGVSQDFNDYGRILYDADNPACAEAALYALNAKLLNSLQYPHAFRRWLDGYNVTLIFAAAHRLGANGWANRDLDNYLVDPGYQYGGGVAGRYSPTPDAGFGEPSPCDHQINTCMDDYAGTASGYAWIAAYQYRRGRSADPFATNARAYIHSSMMEVCIHDPVAWASGPQFNLCNGHVTELSTGPSVTMNFNHGQEMPSYGFGLMTSIASAVEGLEAAGQSYGWQVNEPQIAIALFEQIERHVSYNSSFTNDCPQPTYNLDGSWNLNTLVGCGGPDNYHPNMYALNGFYRRQGFGVPQVPGTYYQSNLFWPGLFLLNPTSNDFFSFGRYDTYGDFGYTWVPGGIPFMPFNKYPPRGYLEQISPTGVAQGWACDQDMPNGNGDGANGGRGLPVNLYDAYGHLATGYANAGSESAINQLCVNPDLPGAGGGTAHRFWVQLPNTMRGSAITAYAIDYTWLASTQLTCLQYPQCSW